MRMEQSTDETEQSAIPSSPIIATVGGISSRVRESAPYGAPEQECCLTSRSRCLQEQARQHEGLDAMRNGASTTSLMCSDRRRSRLMQKRTRRSHAASQRQRGVRNRGRLTGGRERGGQGEVEEGPTWLDGGWCGSCSGGSGPSQVGPGTKRWRASWKLEA